MKVDLRARFIYLFILLTFLVSTGCAITLISEYDASIKDEIVNTSKKVDLFWGELLDTPVAERQYAKFKDKYNEIEVDIRGLVMKEEIRPRNIESTKQAKNALERWVAERKRHKEKDTIVDFEAKRRRRDFIRIFIAMAKGEAVKE